MILSTSFWPFAGRVHLHCLSDARGITVVSTTSTQPPTIAEELRRQFDLFTDLIELRPLIARGLPT